MSGSIASTSSAGTQQAGAASSVTNSGTSDPFASLSSNFSSFLQLLMTQLQNQDPTQPMDSSQFTTELVQFSQVEQQINTNNSLQQLIQLTQAGEVEQSTQMLGHKVAVASTQLTLQNGNAAVQFTAKAAQPVSIVVTDASNNQLYAATVQAQPGSNTWTWNGQGSSGATIPDGAYSVSVTGQNADGTSTSLPFTVDGQVTGVTGTGTAVQVQLGALSTSFSSIRQVLN